MIDDPETLYKSNDELFEPEPVSLNSEDNQLETKKFKGNFNYLDEVFKQDTLQN